MRRNDTEEVDEPVGYVVEMVAPTGTWLTEDLFWLTYLQAYARQTTIRQVMTDLEREFERRHASLDAAPQDVAGIGDSDQTNH